MVNPITSRLMNNNTSGVLSTDRKNALSSVLGLGPSVATSAPSQLYTRLYGQLDSDAAEQELLLKSLLLNVAGGNPESPFLTDHYAATKAALAARTARNTRDLAYEDKVRNIQLRKLMAEGYSGKPATAGAKGMVGGGSSSPEAKMSPYAKEANNKELEKLKDLLWRQQMAETEGSELKNSLSQREMALREKELEEELKKQRREEAAARSKGLLTLSFLSRLFS